MFICLTKKYKNNNISKQWGTIMMNERFNDIYFSYLINLYTDYNDLDAIKEIKSLKLKYPNFPFERYTKGIFTDEHISYYSMDFLLATSKFKEAELYNYGLQGKSEKDKVELFLTLDNLKKLNNSFAMAEEISLDDLKKIDSLLKETDISDFLNLLVTNVNGLFIIQNILCKKYEYYNIMFLANHFELNGRQNSILDYVCDKDFYYFINIIDDNYLDTSMSVESFIQLYKNYMKTPKAFKLEKLDDISIQKLNSAIFASSIICFDIETNNDINDFYESRSKKVSEIIKNNDIENIVSTISIVYYNCDFKDLEIYINDAIKTFKKTNYNYNNLNKYFKILDIKTKEDASDLIKNIKYESNIILSIQEIQKKVTSNDLIRKLNSFSIKSNAEYVHMKGEPFISLLHKIKGYDSYEMATKLYDDISLWLANPEAKEYISTSLCSETFFGLVEGSGYVLGFNNIQNGSILGMGTEDIYMSRKIAKNNLNNCKNRFLLAEDLLENSKKLYNEVSIKRIVDGRPITPDFIFTQDKFSPKEKEVACFFKVPIYILDSEIYASLMVKNQQHHLSNNDYAKYMLSLKKMYFSFSNNHNILYKYFNLHNMEKKLEEIVEVALKEPNIDTIKLYELLGMIKDYQSLIDAKSYFEESYLALDTSELEYKIKKRI